MDYSAIECEVKIKGMAGFTFRVSNGGVKNIRSGVAKNPFVLFENALLAPHNAFTRQTGVDWEQGIIFRRIGNDDSNTVNQNRRIIKVLSSLNSELSVGKFELAEHGGMIWRPLTANPIAWEPGTMEGGNAAMRVASAFGSAFGSFANASWDLINLPGMRLPQGGVNRQLILPMLNSAGSLVDKYLGNAYQYRSKEQLLTIAAAGTTVDSGITFPAKSIALAVGTRIIDAPGNAATMDVGIPADAVRFATGLSTALAATNWGVAQTYTPLNIATAIRITLSIAATDQFQVGITIIYAEFIAGLSGMWDA